MTALVQHHGWLRKLWGAKAPKDADALRALLMQICLQEAALGCHLAERACAVRFGPHRRSLEALAASEGQHAETIASAIGGAADFAAIPWPAPRPGRLTATKLVQDLDESDALSTLYRQAGRLCSEPVLQSMLVELAGAQARASNTIRGVLAGTDGRGTDPR